MKIEYTIQTLENGWIVSKNECPMIAVSNKRGHVFNSIDRLIAHLRKELKSTTEDRG